LIKWRSPERAEELIVVVKHNAINFILVQIRALCMFTCCYDKYTGIYESFHLFA